MHAPGPALCRRSRGCLGAGRARHGRLVCVAPCTCGSEAPHTKGQRQVGRGHCPHLSPRSHNLAPDPAETEDFKFELGLQGHYQGTLVKERTYLIYLFCVTKLVKVWPCGLRDCAAQACECQGRNTALCGTAFFCVSDTIIHVSAHPSHVPASNSLLPVEAQHTTSSLLASQDSWSFPPTPSRRKVVHAREGSDVGPTHSTGTPA